jgi:hypothetical protein
MRKVWTLVSFGVAAALAVGAPAANSAEPIRIQALISPNGTGRLLANTGVGPWSWDACVPDLTRCRAFGNGREIETRGAPGGTVFRVKSSGATGISPVWRGRVSALKPPSVDGPLRANGYVSPVPGVWRGGWKGELSLLQLSACATPAGQDCTALTDPHYARTCAASASFALDDQFTGSYLRVAQRRVGAGPPIEPAYAVTSPYESEVWRRDRITTASVIGLIAPAANPYTGECGAPPPARAHLSKQGIAVIECPAGCRAEMSASRNGHHLQIKRTLPTRDALIASPPAMLRVPRDALASSGTGNLRLVVEINDETVAQRTIRFQH